MTVEVQATAAPRLLAVRLAGALIAGAGRLDDAAALAIANKVESRRPLKRIYDALIPLEADGVVVHIDDVWYAPNLGDLGAWLADAIEAREDAGMVDNPVIPRARVAA